MLKRKTEKRIMNETLMLRSLLQSVVKAGGCAASFTPERLERMTGMELIEYLAPNGFRFISRREYVAK